MTFNNVQYVTNQHGKEIEFNAAVQIMDDEIREMVHAELAPVSNQEFFELYCEYHLKILGEVFEPNKENPVW